MSGGAIAAEIGSQALNDTLSAINTLVNVGSYTSQRQSERDKLAFEKRKFQDEHLINMISAREAMAKQEWMRQLRDALTGRSKGKPFKIQPPSMQSQNMAQSGVNAQSVTNTLGSPGSGSVGGMINRQNSQSAIGQLVG